MSESLFAVRRSHVGHTLLGGSRGEPREHVEYTVVAAETAEAARDFAVSRSSVGAVRAGLTVEVVKISWGRSVTWHATYDGEPLNDNHSATGAKLVVSVPDFSHRTKLRRPE